MFDVLMYLFETYIHTEAELRVDQDKLEQDLTDAGFDREDIYNALLWLEKLADYQEGLAEPMQLASDPLSMRIYTPEECERLDASCRGFVVLGFPCNQFLEQEPGSDEEIKTYCTTTWGVTFPMFSKIEVNGEGRHPLYQKLIAAAPTAVAPEESGFYARMVSKGRAPLYPDDILWNFEKFLVGRDGLVIQRFSPDMTPEDPIVMESIKLALAK